MNSDCLSNACHSYFAGNDADSDGYADGLVSSKRCGSSAPPGYALHGGDCCDSDPNAYPWQTNFFTTPRSGCGGFDYNCDGVDEQSLTCVENAPGTRTGNCPMCSSYWYPQLPACGETATLAISGNARGLCQQGIVGPAPQSRA